MIVIDASVWVSVILASDAHHPDTRAWADSLVHHPVERAVPAPFPAEVVGVLQRTKNPETIVREALATMTSGRPFAIHPISVELGLLAAEAARRTAVRGADAVYLALAAWLDVPSISWDRQQRERGVIFCRTMTPVEAMEMIR